MSRNFSSRLRVLPSEIHFALLNQMNTPLEWKNYSKVYPHLAIDDYFWKKFMVKFPDLTADECQDMDWFELTSRVDFNFTLIYAFETNNVQLAQQVLDYGGNVYQIYKKHGWFLFFIIVRERKLKMARLFLDKGFNINTIQNNNTALLMCLYERNMKTVKFLLQKGADVNVTVDKFFFSALAVACYRNFHYNDDMLQLLTDYGADYNLKSKDGAVALHFLIHGLKTFISSMSSINLSNAKRVFTLCIQKTDISIVDGEGRTFLHRTCSNYRYSNYEFRWYDENISLVNFIIRFFLSAGIPINAQDSEGYTALDYAIHYGLDSTLCELLIQNGGIIRDELVIQNEEIFQDELVI